jgi:transcriptional regulator with XRE-family HTH domain
MVQYYKISDLVANNSVIISQIFFLMLGQTLQAALKSAGISAADAANHIGISEANLYKLFKKDSFEVAYLRKAATLLHTSVGALLGEIPQISDSQIGDSNQAGSGNNQKVKGDNSPSISGNNSKIDMTIDNCKQALKESEREVEYLKGQLARADALVEAKDQTITLLKGRFDRPN